MKKTLFLLLTAPFFTLCANDFPNSSFEYDLLPVWNRMPDSGVMKENTSPFLYSSDRASGKRSLRLAGKKVTFAFESFAKLRPNTGIFALKMKAPKGAKVTVNALFYLNTDKTATLRKSFNVGSKWKSYYLNIGYPFGRARRSGVLTGPVQITVDPGKSELLIDDCFFAENRKAPRNTQGPVTGVPAKEMVLAPYIPLPRSGDFAAGKCRAGEWSFKLFPSKSGAEKGIPLSGVMVFPKSEVFFNSGNFALWDGGRKLAASFHPISAWPHDKSLAALKVDFTADTVSGVKVLKLRFTPGTKEHSATRPRHASILASAPGDDTFWHKNGIFGKAALTAVDYTGKKYLFKTLSRHSENGTLLLRGKLLSSDALALGAAEIRINALNRDSTVLDIAIFNSSKRTLLIRELYWQSELPSNRESLKHTIWGDPGKKIFTEKREISGKSLIKNFSPEGFSQLPATPLTAKSGVSLHVYNAAQTFPNELEFTPGMVRGALWPNSAKVLSFAPGLTLRKKFLISAKGAPRFPDHPAVVMPSAKDFARSGVMIPVTAAQPERFPFFEQKLKSSPGKFNFDEIHNKFLYGQFDYGDHPGDGGWANLESFEDYVLYHRAMRAEDPLLFRQAVTASRHYADIDTDCRNALPHIHSANHIIGGNGFGHAWIPGVMSAWLLTGDGAFYQNARRMLNACIDLPLNSGEIQQGRNFGFYLLTLAEGYSIFNDPAAAKRYMAQLKYQINRFADAPPTEAEQRLQRTSIPRQNSIFYVTSSGLVPFHCWYGLTAFLKMYDLTHDPLIRKTAEKEFANIINLEMTYRPQIETHWPGLPAEQLLPTIATDYLYGRGAFFYPVLAMYAKMSGEKKYLDLAVDTLYCGLLAARHGGNVQDVFMASPMAQLPDDFDEARHLERIKRLLYKGAAPELANGDFSQSIMFRDLVIPRKGIGAPRYPEWAVNKPYPRFWHFVEGKQIISSMFMAFRANYYTLDHTEFGRKAPSLRLDMIDRSYHAGGDLTSAKFNMAPGEWQFAFSFKNPGDARIKRAGMRIMTFGTTPARINVNLSPDGKVTKDSTSDQRIKLYDIKVEETGKSQWKRLSFKFRLPRKSLGIFYMTYGMEPSRKKAHIYLDDVEIKKTGK